MFGRSSRQGAPEPEELPAAPLRVDVPVYLDAGIALSLAASLSRGVSLERSVQTAIEKDVQGALKGSAGILGAGSVGVEAGASRSSAVTESEVRMQTQESIFNGVRTALSRAELLASPSDSWAKTYWQTGDFVEFAPERVMVPLVSAVARLRAIVESVVLATAELSTDALADRIPRLMEFMRSGADDPEAIDEGVSLLSELGQVAQALVVLLARLEEEAEESGLIDIVMFERHAEAPEVIAVASLDRRYVDTKLLRRLAQGNFGVLGKVLRVPQEDTAFNAFRNSMLGATNQLPVLLSRLTEMLYRFPLLLGDSVGMDLDGGEKFFDFVGSASAISELRPLWITPSLEVLPIAIYA